MSARANANTLDHFIAGRVMAPASGAYLENLDPARNELIGHIARGNAADVDAAVNAAEAATRGPWAKTTPNERADLCDAIADRLESRADDLAGLESRDTGKPISLARNMDIARAIANFRFFAGAARHDETGFHHMGGAINYTLRQPLGPVALITPWNLPLYLLSWKTAPALAMGNSIVAKPSELTPSTASALAEIIHEAGVPAGVFNLVHGLGPEVGQALVEHPGIKAVSFTGGTATGAKVAAAAAPMFKKLSLELGGKNPTLVFADCDFDAALEGVTRAAFLNQGEICLCGSRILVERSMVDHFTKALVSEAMAMKLGDPSLPATQMGALISAAHRDKVKSYIALALEEGGTLHCGTEALDLPGALSDGAFVRPTVISGLPIDSRCATEEIFGPVVTVHPFDDDEEALAMANSVRYGLSASVWTRDLQRAHRMGAELESGMVWVNTWLMRDLRVPFGGMKESGVGREGGRYSLEFFSESRNVCIKLH